MDLTAYKALSFDCYGTLIDWEAGIAAVLGPWAEEVGLDLDDERLLAAYADHEAAVERDLPAALYPEVLAMAFREVFGVKLGFIAMTGAVSLVLALEIFAKRLSINVRLWK